MQLTCRGEEAGRCRVEKAETDRVSADQMDDPASEGRQICRLPVHCAGGRPIFRCQIGFRPVLLQVFVGTGLAMDFLPVRPAYIREAVAAAVAHLREAVGDKPDEVQKLAQEPEPASYQVA